MVPDREGHFIDVGARLGEVLVDQQSAVPTLRYVGFEPDPARAQYVSDLIRMNSLSSAQVLPTALTEGAAFDEIRATVAPGRVRLVNIRVGGAEAEVLWGMRATLRTDRPVLLGEVRFAVAEQDRAAERERKQAMEEVLREYCYVILQLVINGQGDIVGGARVREFPLAVESPANRLQRDYLMLPLEELDRLKRHLY